MAEELRLPVRLMNLDALRAEEDRLIHEIHGLRDRLDAIGEEIGARLSSLEAGSATAERLQANDGDGQ